jgi:hypothetical protein
MIKRLILEFFFLILMVPLSWTTAYATSITSWCCENQELRYLLQPLSGAEFNYKIHYESFLSRNLGKIKNFFIILPPDFSHSSSKRYPLLILLHGYNFHRNGEKTSACNPGSALNLLCEKKEEEFHWLLLENIAPIAWAMMDSRNKSHKDLEDDLRRRFQELVQYEGLETQDYSPSEIATSLVQHNLYPDGRRNDSFKPIQGMIILLPDGDNSFYTDEDEGKRLFPSTTQRGGCDIFSADECMKISPYLSRYMKPGALGRYESYIIELMHYLRRSSSIRDRLLPSPYTGIGGFSMGGYGAMKIALRHPELFSSVSSQSGLVDVELLNNRVLLKALMPEFLEVFGHLEPLALPTSSTINESYRRAHNPLRLIREGRGRKLWNNIYFDYGEGERFRTIKEGNKRLEMVLHLPNRMISIQSHNGEAAHNYLFWRSRLCNILSHHSLCLR